MSTKLRLVTFTPGDGKPRLAPVDPIRVPEEDRGVDFATRFGDNLSQAPPGGRSLAGGARRPRLPPPHRRRPAGARRTRGPHRHPGQTRRLARRPSRRPARRPQMDPGDDDPRRPAASATEPGAQSPLVVAARRARKKITQQLTTMIPISRRRIAITNFLRVRPRASLRGRLSPSRVPRRRSGRPRR